MTALGALCILLAVVLILHACATSIGDSEELHELSVKVHTLRNEYLAHLRGEDLELNEDAELVGETNTRTADAEDQADSEAPSLASAA